MYACLRLRRTHLALFVIAVALIPARTSGQTESSSDVQWQTGPGVMALGSVAQINLPEGYRFADARGTKALMELLHNPTSGREQGFVAPVDGSDWFMVFEFSPIGYVKDDEKDQLDADALLASIRRGTEAANKVRRERGWTTMDIVGWQTPPFYDQRTNNLRWAILGRSESSQTVNYSTRLLGRSGVMEVDLVLDPQDLTATLPEFDRVLSEFSFKQGQKYAEFRSGDKVAAYGLAALVAGGAGAAALKSGVLAKFWKVIVLALAGVAAAVKKFIAGLTGRSEPAAETPPTHG